MSALSMQEEGNQRMSNHVVRARCRRLAKLAKVERHTRVIKCFTMYSHKLLDGSGKCNAAIN